MKVSLLVRFGGFALFLGQFFLAIVDSAYYLTGRPAYPSPFIAWMSILGLIIRLFGFMAVFAILVQRGNIFGVLGFLLLVFGEFFSVSKMVMILGVAENVITIEQLSQVTSYTVFLKYQPWFFIAGQLLFGLAIVQSKIDLNIPGMLIALLGAMVYLSNPMEFLRPLFPVISLIAWGWLGWELFTGNDRTHKEHVRASISDPSTPAMVNE